MDRPAGDEDTCIICGPAMLLPTAKVIADKISIHWRPKMFAAWPNSGSTTVDRRMYELVIHMCNSLTLISSAMWWEGRLKGMDVSRVERTL